MAYIYKIINDINQHLYIGKTELTIEQRWKEHKKASRNTNIQNRPLYKAINKYGIEHFHIELIEECSSEIVNDRERYWIEYYGTFKNGYNATIGGDGKPYIDYELVFLTYQEVKNISKVAKLCKIDRHSVSKILTTYGITHEERKRNRELGVQKPVARLDKNTGEVLEVFSSAKEATDKYPQTNKHIAAVCKGKRKNCGGYGWKYLDKNSQLENDITE